MLKAKFNMKISRKFRKNTKAFSAVIASLILMLLAVAAGVVVYGYVMGWIGNAQQSSSNTGVLQIDSITASVSTSKIQLYVRNIGSTDLVLDKIYVAGVAVANATAITSTSGILAIQNTTYLQLTQTLQAARFYDVKVVCVDGTTISTSVEAR
jgi:hypothetical protein